MVLDIFQIIIKYYPEWSCREIIIISIILMLSLFLTIYFFKKNKINRTQSITGMLFLSYLIFVFSSTVFTRMPGERRYQLELFWSWKEIFDPIGRAGAETENGLLLENLLNMVMLLPAGLLLPFAAGRKVKLWHGMFIGIGISFFIEISQLIFCRGLFEFDDIIHNGLGCMAGVAVSMPWNKSGTDTK